MTSDRRIELQLPEAGNPLSREAMIVCFIAPVLFSPLMQLPHLHKGIGHFVRAWAALEVTFIAIPLMLHALYRWPLAKLLRDAKTPAQRWALHALVAWVLGPIAGQPIRPLFILAGGHPSPPLEFAIVTALFCTITLFPAVLLQQAFARARNTERIAQAERQAALEAQMQALQARTNPHFFFNSINTVASLIPENPKLAERTLERLAELFRYALDSSKTRVVPLSREVEVIRDYLAIQQARFGDRLRVDVHLDPTAAQLEVPPLLLQPLVENAIVHGTRDRGGGAVKVDIRRDGSRVLIDITDDGPGPGASEHRGTQTSVRELRERLKLLYGDGGTFELLPSPSGGCVARLALPFP